MICREEDSLIEGVESELLAVVEMWASFMCKTGKRDL